MKPITILLADDHGVVRREFQRILKREADLEVVGEAKNGLEAVALAKKLRPAIVLMDVVMPRLNGLQATRQILAAVPATRVLMFSAHRDDVYVEEAIHAGARGYVIKQSSIDTLGAAVREVHKGNPYFSPGIRNFTNVMTSVVRQNPKRKRIRYNLAKRKLLLKP